MTKETRYRCTVQQIQRLEQRLKRLRKQSQRWTLLRVLLFATTVITAVSALFLLGPIYFWIFLILLSAGFVQVVLLHQRLERWIARFEQLLQIKILQLARLTLDWRALPDVLESADFSHPFEGDLDVVGPHSILRLIDLSITHNGRSRLREWLTETTPNIEASAARQQLVKELLPKQLLRVQLLVHGQLAAHTIGERGAGRLWDSNELAAWMHPESTSASQRSFVWIGWALAGANLVLFSADFFLHAPALWPYTGLLYLVVIFGAGLVAQAGANRRDVFEDAMRLRQPFEQLVALFGRLETYRYRDMPHFKALCAPYLDADHSPSRYLKRLIRIINATGLRGNPLIWLVLNLLVPWDIHFTWQLNRCKGEIIRYLPSWLETWTQIEALCSLANLGYLNPQYTFPQFAEASADLFHQHTATFCASKIGHPLLPDLIEVQAADGSRFAKTGRKVTNDFCFDQLGEVRLITGSNMSGKSTFLRTLGLNMALAYAGGPVNAARLKLERFRLYTSIMVADSVADGISYFYAEVKRLRGLLDVLQDNCEAPVFFLIDEIYRGTNNRERLIGSRAYIKALVGMNGVGLISTHDLDLVTLADDVPQIQNFHFRDEVIGEQMVFDYVLRIGPCPTTNALTIMALEGLPDGSE